MAITRRRRGQAIAPHSRRRRGSAVFAVAVISWCVAVCTAAASKDSPLASTWGFQEILECSPELLLSKILSLGVVAGSCVGKLPQVLDVWRAGSAEGISRMSIWTETVSMGVTLAYNMVLGTPLSTYAEVAILFPQLLLLGIVAAKADGYLGARVWFLCCSISACTAAMALGVVPRAFTVAAYAANAVSGVIIVLPQLVINYRNKSTGQLSFIVTWMTFGGLSTRVFTTFVEVQDLALRITMVANWLLVSLLLLQFFVYRDTRPLPTKSCDSAEKQVGEVPRESSSIQRSASIVRAISAVGSSRCLTDMLDESVVDDTYQMIKSKSSSSFSRFTGSFNSLPALSNSLPELNHYFNQHRGGSFQNA